MSDMQAREGLSQSWNHGTGIPSIATLVKESVSEYYRHNANLTLSVEVEV